MIGGSAEYEGIGVSGEKVVFIFFVEEAFGFI